MNKCDARKELVRQRNNLKKLNAIEEKNVALKRKLFNDKMKVKIKIQELEEKLKEKWKH